jgi:hypothetical protein
LHLVQALDKLSSMLGVFERLLGRRRQGDAGLLAAALAYYPPNTPAHVGPAKRLTIERAEENLQRFLATREERLTVLGSVLGQHGLDIAAILDPDADARPAYDALSDWLADALPRREAMPGSSRINAPIDDYTASARAGDDILFSFIADLALLEGEGIARRQAEWRWDFGRDPADAGTYAFRRVVMRRAEREPRPSIVLDLEHETLETVYAMRASDRPTNPPLGRSLAGIAAGGFDGF